jgi:hypothetical protein
VLGPEPIARNTKAEVTSVLRPGSPKILRQRRHAKDNLSSLSLYDSPLSLSPFPPITFPESFTIFIALCCVDSSEFCSYFLVCIRTSGFVCNHGPSGVRYRVLCRNEWYHFRPTRILEASSNKEPVGVVRKSPQGSHLDEMLDSLRPAPSATDPFPPGSTQLAISQTVTEHSAVAKPHAPQPTLASPASAVSSVTPPVVSEQRRTTRSRKRPIPIYVDADAAAVSQSPAAQRPRIDKRAPLTIRVDSANSTPSPSPRVDDAPWSASPTSPFWDGQENYYPTPPRTPEPLVAVFPHNPAASTGPPPPPSPRARIILPTRSTPLPPPRNMLLYDMLGLNDWRASREVILSAWRRVSREVHPDKVPGEDRDVATIVTQQINAAKEILTNRIARRRYHEDGVLPMAM